MKTLVLTTLLAVGSLSAHAGGYCYYPYRPSFSISVGTGYGGWYAPPVAYYASAPYAYSYGPAYSGYGYGYGRPNYAVGGTLLGAGVGAIIGNNVHHQTWQGAAIGAGAGLLLGGLLEHGVRNRERAAYAPPAVATVQPNYIPEVQTVNDAPSVPAAPRIQTPARPASTMSSANSLFGR